MKLEPQAERIEIIDIKDENLERKRHGSRFPNSIRAIFTGPSGCGKTRAMLSLLLSEFGPRYKNVYIYSTTLFQPLYQHFKLILSGVENFGYYEFQGCTNVLPLCEVAPDSATLFDDVFTQDKKPLNDYYTSARHYGVDTYYACQSYGDSTTSKSGVKDQANFLSIFRQDEANLLHIYRHHVIGDMGFRQFVNMCISCWQHSPYSFLTINKELGLNSGRYSLGFNDHIVV